MSKPKVVVASTHQWDAEHICGVLKTVADGSFEGPVECFHGMGKSGVEMVKQTREDSKKRRSDERKALDDEKKKKKQKTDSEDAATTNSD